MDQYRESFVKAKSKAEGVILRKKNQYLNQIKGADISLSNRHFAPMIHKWYRINGFRAKEDRGATNEAVTKASARWIRSANANCSAFVVDNVEGEINVLFGTSRETDLETIFSDTLPECQMDLTEWSGCRYLYNGVLLGNMFSENIANALTKLREKNWYVACVIVPIGKEEVRDKVRENEALTQYLEERSAYQRVYGSSTRRVQETSIPEVVRAISILKEENKYLLNNEGRGFVRSCMRFGATDRATYERLVSVLRSNMWCREENQEGYEPIRIFEVNGMHYGCSECLAVPRVTMQITYTEKFDLVSWQSIDNLAACCTVPTDSCNGFYVNNYKMSNDDLVVFPIVRPTIEKNIVIGKMKDSHAHAAIPMSALCAHTFVTGATRSGKTTTVKRIIKNLADERIPTLVIESAKKEYVQLLQEIPDLKVYTPGNDGVQLYFNPLQVEEGVLIENHVDAVVRAITAASGGEHPIPEAFEGLLKQTYEQAGWQYGMMAYINPRKPFPTFKDAFDNINSYIKQHAQYGPEVKQNLQGALTLRTANLYTGVLGKVFSKPFGVTAKELLEVPTVIELADFSSSGVEFLMNILLFKLHGHISRLPESKMLKRMIVVEEAHNVFRKTISEDSGRAKNNEYFEKMLAEVGATGTGLILCDQRPSIMSEAVLANTSVKIVHALGAQADSVIMGDALGLSDAQCMRIKEFEKGTCLIGVRGTFGVQYTQVKALKNNENLNPACQVCACRFRCRKEAVITLLQTMDQCKLQYHLGKITASPYNPVLLERNIENMLEDLHVSAELSTKICLLGFMLMNDEGISYQEKRVIVNSYINYRNGGK